MKTKPDKYTFYEFYIQPCFSAFSNCLSSTGKSLLKVFGYWGCHHCKKLHSPRVKRHSKYNKSFIGGYYTDVCSVDKEGETE